MERFSGVITALTPKLQRFADQLVTKILDKLPMLMGQFEAEFPKAIIKVEQFIDKIGGIGKGADDLLGPGGSITLLVTGIGAAFGGLKGAIAANLVKDGMDPFTALVVANIAAQIPASLAAALTGSIVNQAIAAYGAKMAAATVTTTVAGGLGGAAGGVAAGVGGTVATGAAGVAGVSAGVVAGALALPVAIPLALKALGFGEGSLAVSGADPRLIAAAQATTNNIYIGTGKVHTVVTDSINRTGTFKRGR